MFGYLSLFCAGSYSAEHCWKGGYQCDLVRLVRIQNMTKQDNQLFINSSIFASSFPPVPEYVFHGLGQVFHLVLRPDTLAIPGRQSNLTLQEGASCFYSGYVRGVRRSSVAVSLCKGMVSSKCCLSSLVYSTSYRVATSPPLGIPST